MDEYKPNFFPKKILIDDYFIHSNFNENDILFELTDENISILISKLENSVEYYLIEEIKVLRDYYDLKEITYYIKSQRSKQSDIYLFPKNNIENIENIDTTQKCTILLYKFKRLFNNLPIYISGINITYIDINNIKFNCDGVIHFYKKDDGKYMYSILVNIIELQEIINYLLKTNNQDHIIEIFSINNIKLYSHNQNIHTEKLSELTNNIINILLNLNESYNLFIIKNLDFMNKLSDFQINMLKNNKKFKENTYINNNKIDIYNKINIYKKISYQSLLSGILFCKIILDNTTDFQDKIYNSEEIIDLITNCCKKIKEKDSKYYKHLNKYLCKQKTIQYDIGLIFEHIFKIQINSVDNIVEYIHRNNLKINKLWYILKIIEYINFDFDKHDLLQLTL